MAKYRSKPIEVEAVRVSELLELVKNDWDNLPKWVMNEYDMGYIVFTANSIHLKTVIIARKEDWLINNDHNITVCLGKDFEHIYDKVTNDKLSFEDWSDLNEEEINIELAESGADREMDFDPELEFGKRYETYLTEDGAEMFFDTIVNPKGPNEVLKEAAKDYEQTKLRIKANGKAEKILGELNGRGGFDAWWCDIDGETQDEIENAITDITEE